MKKNLLTALTLFIFITGVNTYSNTTPISNFNLITHNNQELLVNVIKVDKDEQTVLLELNDRQVQFPFSRISPESLENLLSKLSEQTSEQTLVENNLNVPVFEKPQVINLESFISNFNTASDELNLKLLTNAISQQEFTTNLNKLSPYGLLSLVVEENTSTSVPYLNSFFNSGFSRASTNFINNWASKTIQEKIEYINSNYNKLHFPTSYRHLDILFPLDPHLIYIKQELRRDAGSNTPFYHQMLNAAPIVFYVNSHKEWLNNYLFNNTPFDKVAYYLHNFGQYAPLSKRIAISRLDFLNDFDMYKSEFLIQQSTQHLDDIEMSDIAQNYGMPANVFFRELNLLNGFKTSDYYQPNRFWNLIEEDVLMQLLQSPQILNNINQSNSKGNTLLHIASASGAYNAIPLLVSLGADINVQNSQGKTPIMLAANAETVGVFLQFEDIDLSVIDSNRHNILHNLIQANNSDPFIQYISLISPELFQKQLVENHIDSLTLVINDRKTHPVKGNIYYIALNHAFSNSLPIGSFPANSTHRLLPPELMHNVDHD